MVAQTTSASGPDNANNRSDPLKCKAGMVRLHHSPCLVLTKRSVGRHANGTGTWGNLLVILTFAALIVSIYLAFVEFSIEFCLQISAILCFTYCDFMVIYLIYVLKTCNFNSF